MLGERGPERGSKRNISGGPDSFLITALREGLASCPAVLGSRCRNAERSCFRGSPREEGWAAFPSPQALPCVPAPAGRTLTSLLALFPNVFLAVTLSLQLLFVIELNVIAMDETELHKQGEMLSLPKTQLKDTI